MKLRSERGTYITKLTPRDYQKYFRRAWTLFLWGAGVENIQAVVTDWIMNDFGTTRITAIRHSRKVKKLILDKNKEIK